LHGQHLSLTRMLGLGYPIFSLELEVLRLPAWNT
jgi:hypothetical protein